MKAMVSSEMDPNKLSLFKFGENDVRIVMKDSEPQFIAKDICNILTKMVNEQQVCIYMTGTRSRLSLNGVQCINLLKACPMALIKLLNLTS